MVARSAWRTRGTVGPMADDLRDLQRALGDDEGTLARRLIRELPAGDDEPVLRLLAERAGAGSALATELLVERLDASGVIRRFVRSMLLDEAAVDDVAQDSLISVAGSIGSYRGGAAVTTWVHAIVQRRVVDHLRRQRAAAPLPDDDASPTQRMSSMLATRATVRAVLDGLPDPYREPVRLRDVEGLTYGEVAERLDRGLGTVKAQISRGRALVAARLREGGWDR